MAGIGSIGQRRWIEVREFNLADIRWRKLDIKQSWRATGWPARPGPRRRGGLDGLMTDGASAGYLASTGLK
jgi:hypothetical protein